MDKEQGPYWRVGTLSSYVIGGSSILLWLFMGVFGWATGEGTMALLTIPMIGMSLVIILMGGTTELTETHIRTFTPLGNYEMAWTEVSGFVFNDYHFSLLLFAPGKRLYIPAPKEWSGRDKHQARMFLMKQLELYHPPLMQGPSLLIFSSNCKQKSDIA